MKKLLLLLAAVVCISTTASAQDKPPFPTTPAPLRGGPFVYSGQINYFPVSAAWAAARRAIGTRNGEQLT